MFSKIFFTRLLIWSFLAAFSLSGLTGCERFIQGNPENKVSEDVVTIEFKEGECLKDVPKQLQKFMKDEAGLGTSIPCIQTALKAFMRQTRGSNPDSYLGKEVQEFFNTYLLKENKISREFQEDIMKIKVVVVGGTVDLVTRVELEKFIEFLTSFEKEISKLQGQMLLMSFKADRKQDQISRLPKLKTTLQEISAFLLKNTRLIQSRYQWSEFLTFMGHLHHFMGDQRDLEELLQWMPLVNAARSVFIGESAKLNTEKQWQEMLEWILKGYTNVLRFQYSVRGSGFQEAIQWQSLLTWTDELLQVFGGAPALKTHGMLEATAIDQLIDEAYKKKIFEISLSADLIKSTYRKALAHFVESPEGQSDALKIKGLTKEHLQVLSTEYKIWRALQFQLNKLYLADPQQSLATLSAALKKVQVQDLPTLSNEEKAEFEQAWIEFAILLKSPTPPLWTRDLLFVIQADPSKSELSFTGANMINAVRSLTRFALRGYGEKKSQLIPKRRISMKKMVELEENFREFGRTIGFLDPDKTTAGKETFDQANLLTFHGNGDGWVDSDELSEVLSILISGGRSMLDKIYEDLEKRNCLKNDLDVFKRRFVDEVCFVKAIREKASHYLTNLPGSAQFINTLTNQNFLLAYQSMMTIAKGPRHVKGQLESGEIRTMASILHFIEAIMVSYDRNRNQLLSQNEVLAAFPRFRDVIVNAAIKEDPLAANFDENIYLYLVYNGEKPPSGKLSFISAMTSIETQQLSNSLGNVDRLKILKLLGTMKEILSDAK